MPKAVVFNLGCKVNQYECDTMISALIKKGYEVSEELVFADVYVVNTCAVTAEAERKSRQILARIRAINPNAYIAICGCASQRNGDFFVSKNVNYVSGVANKNKIIDKIPTDIFDIATLPTQYEEYKDYATVTRTRAYVKIQDGCNNFCTYCIIPYLRGRARSRKIEECKKEIEFLSTLTKEVVITGINMSEYGIDTGESLTLLIDALKTIDVRIRLGSFYVEGIDEGLLISLSNLKHFCPQFHLSLQTGDDNVLRSMNRRYTVKDYIDKVSLIRKYFPLAGITTDIIVGFPTETDQAFANTLEFVKEVGFSDIHIFPYSSRSGTVASKMKVLPPEVVRDRRLKLEEAREELRQKYLEKMIAVPQNVVFEEKEQNGFNAGYSEYYIRCFAKETGDIFIPEKIVNHGFIGRIAEKIK